LLPGFINQLGPDNLANLKKLAESLTAQSGATKDEEPEVENFEAVSNQTETKKEEKKPEAKN
jgi:nascent polypeptide-associated complex subunit beta